MFASIKRLFGQSQSNVTEPAIEKPQPPAILDLRLGGSFTIDPLKLEILQPALTIEGASPTHRILAVGEVKLDTHRSIVRYYTDDDAFLQFQLDGADIQEITLWYFFDTKGVPQSSWDSLLRTEVATGQYELDGETFEQFWEGETPVVLTEQTYRDTGVEETDQFCMVYTRDIDSPHLEKELLLISAEEKLNSISNQHDHELVRSTGFALQAIDIMNN